MSLGVQNIRDYFFLTLCLAGTFCVWFIAINSIPSCWEENPLCSGRSLHQLPENEMGERLKHFRSEKEWKEQLEGFQKRGVARTWLLFMKNRVSWGDLFFLPMLNGPTHFNNKNEITSNDSVLNLASKEVIPLRSSLAVSPKGSVESRTDRVPEDCSEVKLWGQQSIKAGSHGKGVHWRFSGGSDPD